MKNVFGCQKGIKDEVIFDGEAFITKRLNEKETAELEALESLTDDYIKKTVPHGAPVVLSYILYGIAAVIVIGILRARVSLSTAFQNAPYLFFIAPVALLAAIALTLYQRAKIKKMVESDDFHAVLQENESAANRARELLSIPKSARSTDLLSDFYEIKKGKRKNPLPFDFLPLEVYLYADEENLYIADSTVVSTFHLSDIVKLERIEKKVTLGDRNKEDPISSDRYKPYGIKADGNGYYRIKYYYSLQLNTVHGEFELLFPPYEIDDVAILLKLSIPTEPEK